MGEGSDNKIDIIEDGTVRIKSMFAGIIAVVLFIAGAVTEFRDIKRDIEDISTVSLVRVNERHTDLKDDVSKMERQFLSFKTATLAHGTKSSNEINSLEGKYVTALRDANARLNEVEESVSRLTIKYSKMSRSTIKHSEEYEDLVDDIKRDIENIKKNLK